MEQLIQQLEDLFDKIQEGNYLIGQENRDEFYRLTGLLKRQTDYIEHTIDNEIQSLQRVINDLKAKYDE